MVSIIYNNHENNERSQVLASFDISTKLFSISKVSNPLNVDEDKNIMATLVNGKTSEFLDIVDKVLKDQENNDSALRKVLDSCQTTQEADFVFFSLIVLYLKRESISLANIPNQLFKTDQNLFFSLFGLILVGKEKDKSKEKMSLFFLWKNCLESFNLKYEIVASYLEQSLKNLPLKLNNLLKSNCEVLCMIQVWYDNLHKNEDMDLRKIKDRGSLYLATRPLLDYSNNSFEYKLFSRKISKLEFLDFIKTTAIGKMWNLSKNKAFFDDSLKDLDSKEEVEIEGDYFYLTPLGIALSSYLIPRVMKIK